MKKLVLFFMLSMLGLPVRAQYITASQLTFFPTVSGVPDYADYLKMKLAANSAAGITWTLPASNGFPGYVLTDNGSGLLSWTNPSSGSVDSSRASWIADTCKDCIVTNPPNSSRNEIRPSSTGSIIPLTITARHNPIAAQIWQYDNGSSVTAEASMDNLGDFQTQTVEITQGTIGLKLDGLTSVVPYTDGAGLITGAPFGTVGQVLAMNGAGAPVFQNDVGTGGTVTSVAATGPSSLLTWSGTPITTSGTLTASLATQSANLVFAGPTTGSAAAPTFRSLVSADIPSLSGSYIQNQTSSQSSASYNITNAVANVAQIATTYTAGTATALTLTASGSNTSPEQGLTFAVSNSGAGGANDVVGTSGLWKVASTGDATFLSSTLGGLSSSTGTLELDNSASSHYTRIQAGNATANVTYTLPTADGTSGYFLSTNGSGILSWAAAGAGSSILNQTSLQSSASWNIDGSGSVTHTALATTSDNGLILKNTTASTSGATVQVSDAIDFAGRSWCSTSTAADSASEMRIYYKPISGNTASFTNRSGRLTFQYGSPTLGYSDGAFIDGSGSFGIGGTVLLSATSLGTNITAANGITTLGNMNPLNVKQIRSVANGSLSITQDGTGITSSSVSGTDVAGVVTMTATLNAGGGTCTVTFGTTYLTAPIVILTPASSGALLESNNMYATSTATTFVINFSTTAVATNFKVNYIVIR